MQLFIRNESPLSGTDVAALLSDSQTPWSQLNVFMTTVQPRRSHGVAGSPPDGFPIGIVSFKMPQLLSETRWLVFKWSIVPFDNGRNGTSGSHGWKQWTYHYNMAENDTIKTSTLCWLLKNYVLFLFPDPAFQSNRFQVGSAHFWLIYNLSPCDFKHYLFSAQLEK